MGSLFDSIDDNFFCRVDEPSRLVRVDRVFTTKPTTARKHKVEYGTFFCEHQMVNRVIVQFRL